MTKFEGYAYVLRTKTYRHWTRRLLHILICIRIFDESIRGSLYFYIFLTLTLSSQFSHVQDENYPNFTTFCLLIRSQLIIYERNGYMQQLNNFHKVPFVLNSIKKMNEWKMKTELRSNLLIRFLKSIYNKIVGKKLLNLSRRLIFLSSVLFLICSVPRKNVWYILLLSSKLSFWRELVKNGFFLHNWR